MKFNLRYSIDEKVDKISEWTGINKVTIYKMSFYHGIESIKKGFLPVKRKVLSDDSQRVQKIDIPLSHSVNKKINDILAGEYYKKNKITKTALIEQFVLMETKRLNAQFVERLDNNDYLNSDNMETINIRINVPKIIKDEIQNLSDEIDINDNQLYKYLLLTGYFRCIDEALIEAFVFDSDTDTSIERLGINQTEALSLIDDIIYSKFCDKVIEGRKNKIDNDKK